MILCLGPTPCFQRTMTFDRLTLDTVNRTSQVHEFASGKSTNVARVLHTLGERAMAITFIGGMRGGAFRDDLIRAGIEHDLIEVTPATRMAITVVDQPAGTATELLEESHELREADYKSMLATLSKHMTAAKMLVLSGTLPPNAPVDFYARCVKLAEPDVPVIVDAVGEPLLAALEEKPFIIKPNRSEVGRTLKIDVSTDDAFRQALAMLASRGAKWVIATDGPRPTTLTDGRSVWQITPPAVKVVSTIGCGDALAAGLAAALARGQTVPDACRLATACAAANALTPDAGHVDQSEIGRLEKRVDVLRL